MTALAAAAPAPARPWGRAALWLAFLAPFFYVTYGAANWLAAQRADIPSVVFGWERHIPFLAWTIVPYWSINLFYGLSLFVAASRAELDRLGRRLLTAQVVAVACFVLFPLGYSFARPETSGLPGLLFGVLMGFDRPFNQAPSLHIAILVILWDLYARHVPAWAGPALHGWFALVGASVLTTYQHHFLDVPTGALLGLFCLWLWPEAGPCPLAGRPVRDRRRLGLAARYAGGAAALAAAAFALGGAALWLLWPAVSLALVAAGYALVGPDAFQKGADGRLSPAARWLFAPYTLAARVNAWLWTRRDPAPVPVGDGVWLGRLPRAAEAPRLPFAAIVDCCAELPLPRIAGRCRILPMLDLAAPAPEALRAAAGAIEQARRDGPVLVCCALGRARSAAAVISWLRLTGRAADLDAAVAAVRRARPGIVVGPAARAAAGDAA